MSKLILDSWEIMYKEQKSSACDGHGCGGGGSYKDMEQCCV